MFARCPVEFDGAGDYEVEGLKVFTYLHGACVCEPDSEVLCVANVENFHEPVGHPADVGLENRVGASSGIPRARKVARGKLEVGRLEFARERLEDESVVHVFDDAVHGICEFAGFVEVDEKAEMPTAGHASERALDVEDRNLGVALHDLFSFCRSVS